MKKDIMDLAHRIKVAVLAEVGEDYDQMLESRVSAVDFVTQEIAEDFISSDSDYWTRLEHQYAGMAMQGILSNSEYLRSLTEHDNYRMHEVVPRIAAGLSHALVEKMKEERK